jgi:hypothetical protein
MKSFSFDVDWSFLEAPMAPALAAGLLAIIGCAVCLVLLRMWRLTAQQNQAAMRAEFNEMIREQRTECLEEVARLGRQVALVESSAQDVDRLARGFTRPLRARALALLRSGTPPQTIVHELNIGRQEMRLIAHVSRILLPE